MASNPWEILNSNRFNAPSLIAQYDAGLQRSMQERLFGRKMEQEDDALATRKQVGGYLAAGDTAGARKAAATSGDLDLMGKIASMDQAQRAAVKEANDQIGEAIKWADTPQKWQQALARFKQRGDDVSGYEDFTQREALALKHDQIGKFIVEADKGVVMAPGSQLRDPKTGNLIAQTPFAPKYEQVDPTKKFVRIGGERDGGRQGGFGGFYNGFLAGTEGGFAARDGKSGAPVNFGVNQAANPDVDVRNLTQEQAAQILHDRYWVPSGADQIQDPGLQAVHADTAVNMGVGAAKKMLQASGGDPQRYLQLREQRYREIGGPDLKAWLGRNQKLAQYVGQSGGGDPSSGGVDVLFDAQPKPKPQRMSAEEVRAEGLNPEMVYYRDEKGVPVPVPGQDKRTSKVLTEQQAKDGFSARRLQSAAAIFNTLESDPEFNPNQSGVGSAITKWTGGMVNNEKSRKYESAKGEWSDALIRLTTGAAATAPEMESADKTYFPQIGDSSAVVAQKKKMRENVMAGALERAGPGAPGGSAVRVNTPAEARALKPGTKFITPDGRTGTR